MFDLPNLSTWEQIGGDYGDPVEYGGEFLNHETEQILSIYGFDCPPFYTEEGHAACPVYLFGTMDREDLEAEEDLDEALCMTGDEDLDLDTLEGRAHATVSLLRYSGLDERPGFFHRAALRRALKA